MAKKQATMMDIVRLLNMQGHNIQYRKRSDGSIRITQLDGVSYKGSSGNIRAREMAGVTLSEARARQLQSIKTKKGSKREKKAPLPEAVLKKIARVQRMWKKYRVERDGYVGRRGARYNIETYGEEEALHTLEEQERYAKGLAYSKAVEWLISYTNDVLIPKAPAKDIEILNKLTKTLERRKAIIQYTDIYPFQLALYDYGKGALSAEDLYNQIDSLLDIHEKYS